MSGWGFHPPYALPWDVNVIKVNYRCLDVPHIHRDLDGYFTEPPVFRSITAKLMEAPKGFTSVVQPRAAHIAMLPILTQVAKFDFDSYKAPMRIFQFGVDLPYKRKFGDSHV